MDVNDDEGRLDEPSAPSFFASKLAPTYIDNQQGPPMGACGQLFRSFHERYSAFDQWRTGDRERSRG